MRCLRRICGYTLKDCHRTDDFRGTSDVPTVASQLQQLRMMWLGHIQHREDDKLTKQILHAYAPGQRRPGARLQDWHMLMTRLTTFPITTIPCHTLQGPL